VHNASTCALPFGVPSPGRGECLRHLCPYAIRAAHFIGCSRVDLKSFTEADCYSFELSLFSVAATCLRAQTFVAARSKWPVTHLPWAPKEQVTKTHASLRQVEIGSPEFFPMYSLGHKHWKLPAGRRVFSQSGLHTDSIFGANPGHHRASLDSCKRTWDWKRVLSDMLRG